MLAYESVAPNDLGFEGVVLQVYFLADQGTELEATHPFVNLVRTLRALDLKERLEFSAFQLERPRDGIGHDGKTNARNVRPRLPGVVIPRKNDFIILNLTHETKRPTPDGMKAKFSPAAHGHNADRSIG